jgi:hypothetical protein
MNYYICGNIGRMYNRTLAGIIKKRAGRGKAIILIGPRQVGKTTLLRSVLDDDNYMFLDGDDSADRERLTSPNTEQIRNLIGKSKVVFIDEAQRIEGIGITLKIIVDQLKDVQLYVSGSSSYDLANLLSEPLTGRKWEYEMLPISWEEFEQEHGYLMADKQLETRLIYGFYPDVLNNPGDEPAILKELVSSYLYRDILAYSNIRKPEVLEKLVQALALQVGSEVNFSELAQTVGVDKNTVSSYIDVLQQGYVVFKLGSYSNNIRNEIKKNKKIYFYDNGVRNTVLGNYNSLSLRQDTGALWENFLMAERVKQNKYKSSLAKMYFWRTQQQQEVDLVESNAGKITGFEFKWNGKKKVRLPKTFVEAYNADQRVVDKSNFRDFVVINP